MKANFGQMIEALDVIAASGLKTRAGDSLGKIMDRYEADLASDDPKVKERAERMLIAIAGALL